MKNFRVGPERLAVAIGIAGAAAVVGYVGLRALALPGGAAAVLVTALGGAGAWWLARALPAELVGLRRRRPVLCGLWLVMTALALVQTARLSAFMVDPARVRHSITPWDDWQNRHSCLTGYVEAARLHDAGKPNVYDPVLYGKGDRRLGTFQVDSYHYPPPFCWCPWPCGRCWATTTRPSGRPGTRSPR